ncbi:hypothetical protein U9M48_002098 [Paspalum notatum var. saurae]|uniref:Rx N-terminal domain-containing protein n=1 Tax=Paspalum notatum var. saurae TaxID=547442 RepID=A0AAQ3PJ90_PASNO
MADLTHSAVDSLLSLLASAIKDEAKLLRGIPGDILFIRDEMDSMNGFLLHLTKMDTEHDDQVRAWMKHVRDIANLAQDYIQLYVRDLHPPDLDPDGANGGLCARIRHLHMLLRARGHALAKEIAKLKSRVQDVGERCLHYDVRLPTAKPKPRLPAAKPKPRPPLVSGEDSQADERDTFLRALEEKSFDVAIGLLPGALASEDGGPLHEILNKDHGVDDHVGTMNMLLRALYAYPHGTKEELEKLSGKLKDRAADVPKEVMVFCYSKLSTHYKSCLQYLTTFLDESSISRTSLVRRWVAKGLVAREEGLRSMEEAGERCFDELVFHGFIRPVAIVATGIKIKSCTMDDSVQSFIVDMGYGREKPPLLDVDDKLLHPMDEIARLLKDLPQEYRLNVLDLGGCRGLEKRHLKSICKVPSIKYLSLRNTDVSRLPKAINDLWQLETLDVRQTHLLRPSDMERIYLPRLKHLLAGHIAHCYEDVERLSTLRMPRKISNGAEGRNLDYEEPNGDSIPSPPPSPTPTFLESLNIKCCSGSQTIAKPVWLCILGKLESLCCLRLRRSSYMGHTISLNTGEFSKLRLLLIDHVTPTLKAIAFQAEAALNLEKVVWTVDSMVITPDTISEIRHLPASLKVLELNGDWTGQRYLKEALAENTKCPLVRYSSPDPDFPFDEKSPDVFVKEK